jgi:hypothetical protein
MPKTGRADRADETARDQEAERATEEAAESAEPVQKGEGERSQQTPDRQNERKPVVDELCNLAAMAWIKELDDRIVGGLIHNSRRRLSPMRNWMIHFTIEV